MFWVIGIAGVWTFSCVMTVALCVMARRGDERLSILLATVPDSVVDVDFVVTLAAPEPAPGVSVPPASRVSR